MKYLAAGIAATVIVVGGVAAGSLVISDRKIDQQVARLTTVAEQSGFTVEIIRDENEWLTRRLDLLLASTDGSLPVPVLINNDITQRPWQTVVQHEALLDSALDDSMMDSELQTLLNRYLVDRAFMTGTTQIGMTGAYETQLRTVAVNESDTDWTMTLAPMSIEILGSVSGALNLQGEWPGMQFTAEQDGIDLVVAPARFTAEGTSLPSGLFDGAQSASFDSIAFQVEDDYSPLDFTVEAWEVTSLGSVDGELYSGSFTVAIASLNINDSSAPLSVADLNLTTSITGLETANYERLMAEVTAIQSTGVPSVAMKNEASQLLKNGFKIALDDWHATVNGQSVQLMAQVTVPKNELADVNVPLSLLGLFPMVSASADVTIDAGLADVPVLYDPLMGLLMTGALISEGDEYMMKASLQNGQVMLNGQPMPLPF